MSDSDHNAEKDEEPTKAPTPLRYDIAALSKGGSSDSDNE